MKPAVKIISLKEMTFWEASTHFSVPKSILGDRFKEFSEGKEVQTKPKLWNSKDFARTFYDQQKQIYNHIKDLDS